MRSTARAHLSQLIEMFGTDGCLRVDIARGPDPDDPDVPAPLPAPDRSEPEDEARG